MAHGVSLGALGWTICREPGSDRPVYEADTITCRHCGKTKFACDPVTNQPLPAAVVYDHCPSCHGRICARCKNRMRNNGAICTTFIDKIDAKEDAFNRWRTLGAW